MVYVLSAAIMLTTKCIVGQHPTTAIVCCWNGQNVNGCRVCCCARRPTNTSSSVLLMTLPTIPHKYTFATCTHRTCPCAHRSDAGVSVMRVMTPYDGCRL